MSVEGVKKLLNGWGDGKKYSKMKGYMAFPNGLRGKNRTERSREHDDAYILFQQCFEILSIKTI